MDYGQIVFKVMEEEKNRALYSDPKQKFFYLQHQENNLLFQVKYKDIEKSVIVLDYISVLNKTPILDVDLIKKKLSAQAEAIQKRITFLLEDFKLIEMDNQNKRAQLRSYPPYTRENSKYYYEIVLDEGTRAHFQRYEYSMAEKRYEKITSQLTRETFERLVNELVEILK